MSTGSRTLHFILDGEWIEIVDPPPTMTLLTYLRDELHRTGTKEGCAEGDCGACTVVVGELAPCGKRIEYRAVNSCIRFLPTLDGHELITVESLASGDALHPVQQAMLDYHASQCGFCTPGFVMSLFALYLQKSDPQRDEVIDALAGNLCRCTGYRPIVAAGCAMAGYPEPVRWSRRDAQSPARIDALAVLRQGEPLSLPGFHAPRDIAALTDVLTSMPNALILAGGTDVGLWVTKQLRELPRIVYIGAVAELKAIRNGPAGIEIGAAVALTDAWRALLALYPQLGELARRFASPPVCNAGTLCGNIANGSPVGDSMPILLALGAELELRSGNHGRRLPLERFYLGYQRKALQAGELIVSVSVPYPRPGQRVASYKVSKRFDQDIAAVCAGFVLELDGASVSAVRIAFGGMAAIPIRAHEAEAALLGQPWNEHTLETAASALAHDFSPLTDLRASSSYRLQTAANLLRRFFSEGRTAHLHVSDVRATNG